MARLVFDYMDPRARARRMGARLRLRAGNLLRRIPWPPKGEARWLRNLCRQMSGGPPAASELERVREWYGRVVGGPVCVRHAGRAAVEVRRGVPLCGVCLHELEGEPVNAAACFGDGP